VIRFGAKMCADETGETFAGTEIEILMTSWKTEMKPWETEDTKK
jgi:hypothetical protein